MLAVSWDIPPRAQLVRFCDADSEALEKSYQCALANALLQLEVPLSVMQLAPRCPLVLHHTLVLCAPDSDSGAHRRGHELNMVWCAERELGGESMSCIGSTGPRTL